MTVPDTELAVGWGLLRSVAGTTSLTLLRPLQSHSWWAVDSDTPAEPRLAEHALPGLGTGARPCRGVQGGDLRCHEGGRHFRVPPTWICCRPARLSQCHQDTEPPPFDFIDQRAFPISTWS